jgi:hypothetical protein
MAQKAMLVHSALLFGLSFQFGGFGEGFDRKNRYGSWAAVPVRLAFLDFSVVDAIERAILRKLILSYDSRYIARIVAACFIHFIRGSSLSIYIFSDQVDEPRCNLAEQ